MGAAFDGPATPSEVVEEALGGSDLLPAAVGDRAKRTLKGIDQQIAKAEQAVAGKTAVKRNRFVQLTGATKKINRDLETEARNLAGVKSDVANLHAPTAEYVFGAYHHLWEGREKLSDVQD